MAISRLLSTRVVSAFATLLLSIVFVRLGLWQLDRAEQKTNIIQASESALELPPLTSVEGVTIENSLYRTIRIAGQFDVSRQFLLDNKIYNSQPGFEVITPLVLGDGSTVLVNRGWVALGASRQDKPDLSKNLSPGERVTLTATLTNPSKGFTLGAAEFEGDSWPLLLQYIDYGTIADKLDKILAIDAVLLSADGQPWNYAYNWQPVASGPERHYGYAFQWFAMLVTLLAFYVYLNFLKRRDKSL